MIEAWIDILKTAFCIAFWIGVVKIILAVFAFFA
jgi:hypothetical protein